VIVGYQLVQAVLVATLGRLGDMHARVRAYDAGFVVFTVASVLLSFDPYVGASGALWLIAWQCSRPSEARSSRRTPQRFSSTRFPHISADSRSGHICSPAGSSACSRFIGPRR